MALRDNKASKPLKNMVATGDVEFDERHDDAGRPTNFYEVTRGVTPNLTHWASAVLGQRAFAGN